MVHQGPESFVRSIDGLTKGIDDKFFPLGMTWWEKHAFHLAVLYLSGKLTGIMACCIFVLDDGLVIAFKGFFRTFAYRLHRASAAISENKVVVGTTDVGFVAYRMADISNGTVALRTLGITVKEIRIG